MGRQGHSWGPTHQKHVHHVVLCHVAILGGVLNGLWKERNGGYQYPQRRGPGTEPAAPGLGKSSGLQVLHRNRPASAPSE